MFPEESTDVHISSSPSSLNFNSIPIQSLLLSTTKSINEQKEQNILAKSTKEIIKRTTGSAQAINDVVIDIPTLSSLSSEAIINTITTTKSINETTLQSIQSSKLSSSLSITLPSSISLPKSTSEILSVVTTGALPTTTTISITSSSSSSETIPIDRIVNRNENDEKQQFNKFNNAIDHHYKCIPPPLFVILVSIIEVAVFLYESWAMRHLENYDNDGDGIPVPNDSILVYRPDRRQEVWRFFSYMVLHANWFHLSFNVIVQLIIGLPLELVHGSIRICCIYLAGVFAGSLGTSVVDSKVYLVGASGGVYALLGSHLANILLNYKQIKYVAIKLITIFLFSICDIGFAIYTRYFQNIDVIINVHIGNDDATSNIEINNSSPPISYVAHLSGVLAGLTIGLLILKNFQLINNTENNKNEKTKLHKHLLWWTALGVYLAFIIFTITFNVMNTMTAQILEEKGQVIKQYLFHNLGSP